MPIQLMSFADAIQKSSSQKKYLLLGNGFSVGFRRDIFSYASMTKKSKQLTPELQKIFKGLNTVDFEESIRHLEIAQKVCDFYEIKNQFKSMAEEVRNALIQTIAEHHPNLPSDITESQLDHCVDFLKHFSAIYTLNYDMLLYWVLMRDNFTEGREPKTSEICVDGFAYNGEDFLYWDGDTPKVYYLHGALHLFENTELEKLNYSQTGIRLKDQFTKLIFEQKKMPLFVTEGDSDKKKEKINKSGYLSKGYRSLQGIGAKRTPDAMFLFGASLSETDNHIVKALVENNVQDFYVGIFGSPEETHNQALIQKAQRITTLRAQRIAEHKGQPARVHFFNSAEAKVWG